MRNLATKVCIALAVTALGMYGADSFVGTWKLNVAASNTTLTNPFKTLTDVREAMPDGGMKLTRTGQRADGTPVNGGYACKYDGQECRATGLQYDTLYLKRLDANTLSFETRKTGGGYHTTGRTVISRDGKRMTQTSQGTDATGKAFSQTLIFEKQ